MIYFLSVIKNADISTVICARKRNIIYILGSV